MKHDQLDLILQRLKGHFKSLYQEQLEAIILYGSQAREDAKEDSDIDILVIVESAINPYQEIDKSSAFIAALCLEYDVVISRHFMSAQSFQTQQTPFLFNVRREGIIL
ncbi:MAG: nucleotidyltransferase domain-containing protein [Microcystaceae cyanobacterium]